jgi:hypothetical protein
MAKQMTVISQDCITKGAIQHMLHQRLPDATEGEIAEFAEIATGGADKVSIGEVVACLFEHVMSWRWETADDVGGCLQEICEDRD